MPLGRFSRIDVAVKEFIYSHLQNCLFAADCPTVLGVKPLFASFLAANGSDRLAADEHAERHVEQIRFGLMEALEDWRRLRLRPPCLFHPTDDVLVTWRYAEHEALLGEPLASSELIETYNWVRGLDPQTLLLATAYLLYRWSCNVIYITDGKYDGGVDLIAKVGDGPFCNAVIFIQVKSLRTERVGIEMLLQEYAKFKALPATDLYRRYLLTTRCEDSIEGSPRMYAFVTNSEFQKPARRTGAQLGIMLRSGRQMANVIKDGLNVIKSLKSKIDSGSMLLSNDVNIYDYFVKINR